MFFPIKIVAKEKKKNKLQRCALQFQTIKEKSVTTKKNLQRTRNKRAKKISSRRMLMYKEKKGESKGKERKGKK